MSSAIGDPSSSQSERWEVDIINDQTGVTRHHCNQGCGQTKTDEYGFVKGKSSTLRIRHTDTNRGNLGPDFDWCFLIDGSTATGIRTDAYGGIYIVEDTGGLLTTLTNGGPINFTEGREVKITVPKIITETVFEFPPDRSRKTIGVGEEVKLSISTDLPVMGAIGWYKNGGGDLTPFVGSQTTFTAPDHKTNTTVTLLFNGMTVDSVTFHTIEPDDLMFENDVLYASGCDRPPDQNYLALLYRAKVYLRPTTVNFGMVSVLEGFAATQTEPGYFRDHPFDPHNQWKDPFSLVGKSTWVEGKGTRADFREGGDLPGGTTQNVYQVPLYDGYAWWDLPWMFSVGDAGPFKTFTTVKQDFRVIGAGTNGLFRITKRASGAEIKTEGDPAAYFITP